MRTVARNLMAITALCVAGLRFAAADETIHDTVPRQTDIQVIHIVLVSTNRVMLGTNTLSLTAATNVIGRHRDTVDVIAIHGSIDGDASARATSSAVAEIARAGVPLVFVEKDGEYAWRAQSGNDGIRTVRIGTDQLGELLRFWRRGRNGTQPLSGPVLQTTLDWDTDAGTYDLQRIELGLLGKRVWLVHEQRESDDKTGTLKIQFQKEW